MELPHRKWTNVGANHAKLGQAAPYWTANTIGCDSNRNGDIKMPLSLKTEGNIALVDHRN